jgi:hypothetical protein
MYYKATVPQTSVCFFDNQQRTPEGQTEVYGTADFSLLPLRQTPFVVQLGGVAVAVFGALPKLARVGTLV